MKNRGSEPVYDSAPRRLRRATAYKTPGAVLRSTCELLYKLPMVAIIKLLFSSTPPENIAVCLASDVR
jgi:hypothetical protein